jgi:NADH-quinone oxidoreductase subunit E
LNELQKRYPEDVAAILKKYPPEFRRSAIMPLLYLAQRQDGHVSGRSVTDIAELTGLSTTDVTSVVGFYTLFHAEAGGRYRIQVCTDLPCALRGADDFLALLQKELGISVGETTPDGMFTIEEVKCLAACHRAPMFQVQGDGDITYHEHQTVESAMQVLKGLRQQAQKSGKGAA